MDTLLVIRVMTKQSPPILILKFRLRQFWRIVKDVGWTNLILLSPFLILLVLGTLEHLSTTTHVGSVVVISTSLGTMHWQRKDRWLLQQFSQTLFPVFLVEYLVLLAPIWVSLMIFGQWLQLGFLWLMILLIALYKPAVLSNNQTIRKINFYWIPKSLFEWRTGLRRHLWWYVIGYLILLIWSYHIAVVPIGMVIFALAVVSFFNDLESRDLLLVVNYDQNLLTRKISQSLLVFHTLLLPLYGLFNYFHYQYWYVWAVLFIINSLLIAFAICVKYKSYRFEHQKVHNNLAIGVFIGCWSIPFLWPVPLIMLVVYWRQAQRNLIHHYA